MKNILIVIFVVGTTLLKAQDNLVPNSTFQTVTKKVKSEGQIKLAEPWTSPTTTLGDLYVTKTKSTLVGVPANAYGEEKPMKGDNYAGILAFSNKDKEPRSYLQVKLTEKLEAGKKYCVKAHVSLADISKFACNGVAIALTNEELTESSLSILKFDNTIVSRRQTIYETQFYWTPICGVYTAKGGEEYITIGNFTESEKLKTKKIKRPRGFTKPQTYDAYYFVDNVSVIESDKSTKCDCDVIAGMEDAETVSRDFNSEKESVKKVKVINSDGSSLNSDAPKEVSAEDVKVDGMVISFDPKSFSIVGDATPSLDKIVTYMKANPKTKISITGYVDKSEKDIPKLDGKRVSSVYKYIVSKGIAKERVKRNMGGQITVSTKDILKNMRVTVSVVGS